MTPNLMCLTIFLIVLIDISVMLDLNQKDDPNLVKKAKRNLLCREKEYFKKQPMSKELRNFIMRHKRQAKLRSKHSVEDSMYVIKDGDVIPFNQIKSRDIRNDIALKPGSDQGKFTVLPLVLPRSNDKCEETEQIAEETSTTTPKTTRIKTFRAKAKLVVQTEEYDDIEEMEATTKGVMLAKVLQDVQELIKIQTQSRTETEMHPCNVLGDWDSFAGGMQLRISFLDHEKQPKIVLVAREPEAEGFLSDNNWKVTGLLPFPQQALISITAISTTSKKLAVFLGECRSCEGSDTISGYWMVRRRSKSCKDREEANSFISDVLRRNNVRKLQLEHIAEIKATTVARSDE